jgi:hypothetical protein
MSFQIKVDNIFDYFIFFIPLEVLTFRKLIYIKKNKRSAVLLEEVRTLHVSFACSMQEI